jgi:hypothetical protein
MTAPELGISLRGIGLLGPGLPDWAHGRALLREPGAWRPDATELPPAARLPATERRRAGAVVRLALVVADEAVGAADADPAALPTVFSSSTGDPLTCHLLCETLATPARAVSPTRFTNSVHNAPAGYWHIATKSMQASTSLSGFDASFSVGLLEAAAQCVAADRAVLLVACDVPYPEPLHRVRPLAGSFGVAFVLAPGAQMRLRLRPGAAPTACADAGLEALRAHIPAARSLPLLQALAQDRAATLVLEGLPGQSLQIEIGAR